MITAGYTPLEVMENEKMLYATVPVGRPMDNELKGFEEIEAMGLEEECVYGTFVRKFIDKVADYAEARIVDNVKKYTITCSLYISEVFSALCGCWPPASSPGWPARHRERGQARSCKCPTAARRSCAHF